MVHRGLVELSDGTKLVTPSTCNLAAATMQSCFIAPADDVVASPSSSSAVCSCSRYASTYAAYTSDRLRYEILAERYPSKRMLLICGTDNESVRRAAIKGYSTFREKGLGMWNGIWRRARRQAHWTFCRTTMLLQRSARNSLADEPKSSGTSGSIRREILSLWRQQDGNIDRRGETSRGQCISHSPQTQALNHNFLILYFS